MIYSDATDICASLVGARELLVNSRIYIGE